jgi:hypothetical protein
LKLKKTRRLQTICNLSANSTSMVPPLSHHLETNLGHHELVQNLYKAFAEIRITVQF